jgi:hypothetical protein
MNRRAVVVLLASLIGFVSPSRADHLPDNLQARGAPETTLAAIHLTDRTKLADVIKLYGQPTKVSGSEETDPNIASSYHYYWVRPGLNLHVLVERLPRKIPGWEYVSLVEVDSGTSRKIARTGKGLKVGDSLKDLKRIYGYRFKVRDIPKLKIHDVMIQWHREEYSLVATLDRRNRITSLRLSAPE